MNPIDPGFERPAVVEIDQVYQRDARRLRGLASAITLDPNVADEIVQDAFAGLTANAGSVWNPVGYLQRSVVNLSVRVVQRRRTVRRQPIAPPATTSIPEIDETWEVVVRLPPRQRAVVVLRFWEDLSLEQIADVMEMPVGTVKSALHRALTKLKEELR